MSELFGLKQCKACGLYKGPSAFTHNRFKQICRGCKKEKRRENVAMQEQKENN